MQAIYHLPILDAVSAEASCLVCLLLAPLLLPLAPVGLSTGSGRGVTPRRSWRFVESQWRCVSSPRWSGSCGCCHSFWESPSLGSQPIRSGESQLLRRPMSNSGLAVALPRGPPLMLLEGANVAGGTGLFQVVARLGKLGSWTVLEQFMEGLLADTLECVH